MTITVCKEMLKQRGYSITGFRQEEYSHKIFFYSDLGSGILIINLGKLDVNSMKNELVYVTKNNIKHCIFVYSNVTSYSYNIKELYKNIKIEIFKSGELSFNITHHQLVPKHTKLNAEDRGKFVKEWGTNIPIILSSDPISRFYAYDKDDIIKITRKSGYVSYRIVR